MFVFDLQMFSTTAVVHDSGGSDEHHGEHTDGELAQAMELGATKTLTEIHDDAIKEIQGTLAGVKDRLDGLDNRVNDAVSSSVDVVRHGDLEPLRQQIGEVRDILFEPLRDAEAEVQEVAPPAEPQEHHEETKPKGGGFLRTLRNIF